MFELCKVLYEQITFYLEVATLKQPLTREHYGRYVLYSYCFRGKHLGGLDILNDICQCLPARLLIQLL